MKTRETSAVFIGISGFGKYYPDTNGDKYVEIMCTDIKALVDAPQRVDKNSAQWLIPSTFHSRKHKEQMTHGAFALPWVDFDEQPKPLGAVAEIAETLNCD